jgi:deazaflavin-dependent oxidoreductase (nitroreductase family)
MLRRISDHAVRLTAADAGDFNDKVIAEFRAHEGQVGGPLAGTRMMLIHHVGARSGTERVTPVAYDALGDGRFVIVASNGGAAAHPAWYHNLKASPRIEVELGSERFMVLAQALEGGARAALWPQLVAASPTVAQHQAKTTRQFALFVLTREP